jgi:exoribonuclease R
LNKKLKKRDETIYIKNYYQPMLYDSLKNLLSLKENDDKLAFTLSFKVNS